MCGPTRPDHTHARLNPSIRPWIAVSVVFTASQAGCQNPQFRFLAQPPGGSWRTVRAYSASPTFTWNTTGLAPGTWQIGVWVREVGSGASYDAYAFSTYVLSKPHRCPNAAATSNVPSPQQAGATVTFQSYAACSPAEYEFWRLAPGGTWTIVRPYDPSDLFSWDTTAFANGRYLIGVWARTVGSPNSRDAYVIFTYYIGT